MELVLVVTSLGALVLAIVMSIVAWKLLRHGRERAAARIEALEGLAYADPIAEPDPVRPAPALDPAEPEPDPSTFDDPWDLSFREPEPRTYQRSDQPVRRVRREPEIVSEPPAVDVAFGATVAHRSRSRRGVVFAMVALVVFLGVGSAFAVQSAQPIAEFVGGILQPRPNLAAAEPLELLSLRHGTTPSGTFTVTGLVQNPAEGLSLENIVAVVYLFDENGQYFASGRAELDLPAFRPGDESPFVVIIPDATGVSRYRVGFRLHDGGVVGHIDRRGQLPHNTTGDALEGIGRAVPASGAGSRPVEG